MRDTMDKRRYIAFSGDCYYPGGGMRDFQLRTDNLEEAKEAIKKDDWGHILDLETMEVINE